MPIRAVLFDFDGTLADSFAAITASLNFVRVHYGLPELPESEVRHYVGYGLANIIERLVPIAPVEEAIALYRPHYAQAMLTQTKLLPGVEKTLVELARRGLHQGVCSNKNVEFTRKLVQVLGLSPYFECVLGPDDVNGRPKPDPAMLLEGLARLKVSKEETIYVGDMAVDVHTARAAGMTVWLVPGGAEGDESAVTTAPDRVLRCFEEILELL
jgi:phosphoglycolate phosphatase